MGLHYHQARLAPSSDPLRVRRLVVARRTPTLPGTVHHVSPSRTSHRGKHRRRRWIIAGAVVLVVLAWGALVAAQDPLRLPARPARTRLPPRGEGQPVTRPGDLGVVDPAARPSPRRIRRRPVGPVVAAVRTGRRGSRHRAPAPVGEGAELGRRHRLRSGLDLPRPGRRPPPRAPWRRTRAGGVAPPVGGGVAIGRQSAGGGGNRTGRRLGLPARRQAQRVRFPTRLGPHPVGQRRRRVGGYGFHPGRSAALCGPCRQQRRDAGRVGCLPRRRRGHHDRRDRHRGQSRAIRRASPPRRSRAGDRRPAAQLGLALAQPGHAQPGDDPQVRRHRAVWPPACGRRSPASPSTG